MISYSEELENGSKIPSVPACADARLDLGMNTVLNLHCWSFYWRGKSLSVGISFGFNIVLELMNSGPCYYLCEV
jgi:hypothetical protein